MPKVNQKILTEVLIPLPDAECRTRIVNRLDSALNMAARLVKRIDTASRIVDRSSQAVLARAFRGELIPAGVETVSSEPAAGRAPS
jgi:type I restriction enzyme S subunit